jgi:hypothetical protein
MTIRRDCRRVGRARLARHWLLGAGVGLLFLACDDGPTEPRAGRDAGIDGGLDAGWQRMEAGTLQADSAQPGDGGSRSDSAIRRPAAAAPLSPVPGLELQDGASANPKDLDASTRSFAVRGQATFTTTDEGIDLRVTLSDCRAGYAYRVFIHEGSDCRAISRETRPWERGAEIPHAFCGALGGRSAHSRSVSASNEWTLDGTSPASLVGRALAVHAPGTLEPLACGIIELDPARSLPPYEPKTQPSAELRAHAAGLCVHTRVVRASSDVPCPNREKLTHCASVHCKLSECVDTCADYLSCIERAGVSCHEECIPDDGCEACTAQVFQCTLAFCEDEVSCAAPPTPAGPCSALQACCARQGPIAENCFDLARILTRVSGDPTCEGALHDWDFLTNGTYVSPCSPDGGILSEAGIAELDPDSH